MIRSSIRTEPFNGSNDMISISERAAAFPLKVIVTARAAGMSVWSKTIVIHPLFFEQTATAQARSRWQT